MESYSNVYANAPIGATPNPVMPDPDATDEQFASDANAVLSDAVELIRHLVGAHQSAAAIIVDGDWGSIRKYFSLSQKYEAWRGYQTPATGYGIHGWLLTHNKPVRLTQAELEAHPEYKGFGAEAGKHPPMRGWLTAPIIDSDGRNWGLLQLSDKYEGEFSAQDEANLVRFTGLLSRTLEALWEIRNLRKETRSGV
ncbi:MAG: GAF domain-containing protein [Akkermansiaceae bacterium]|nr:GAF domain-containing protein [Armatimonadota bacterium]